MGIIGWIVLGFLAGLIAKAIMPGGERVGIILTTVLGVGGALLGGFIATALGLGDPIDEFFDLSTWVAAVVGALIILYLWNASGPGESPDRPPAGNLPSSPAPLEVIVRVMHRVEIERHPHLAIVLAAGELDAFAAPDLASALTEVRGERRVLADLDQVSFMDSTVLGLIVRAARELGESGAELRIVLPGGSARRIFEITALDRVLPVAETRVAAVADLTT